MECMRITSQLRVKRVDSTSCVCLQPANHICNHQTVNIKPCVPRHVGRGPASTAVTQATTSNFSDGKSRLVKYEQSHRTLLSDDIRHPLDQQNTSLLRSVPGLEGIAKNLMGPIAEQVLLLENISTSIKIGPDQLPTIYNLLTQAADTLQMEPPELYIRQNPIPNAYTLAITGRKPFIVLHTALVELLTPRELQAVLAHELGHLKCDHGLWLTVANVLANGTVSVLPVISSIVEEALMRWLRAAELTCDRAALLVAQDSRVVVSALMKLAGGSPSYASELNVDAFLEQARSYEEATSSLTGWYFRNAQTRALSHPLPVMRAREIDRWAHSAQFRALLSKHAARQQPALPETTTDVAFVSATAFGMPSKSPGSAALQQPPSSPPAKAPPSSAPPTSTSAPRMAPASSSSLPSKPSAMQGSSRSNAQPQGTLPSIWDALWGNSTQRR